MKLNVLCRFSFCICFFFLISDSIVSQVNQIAKIVPWDDNGISFGQSVDISGSYAIIGCPGDTTYGPYSGAVYIYDISELSLAAKLYGDDIIANIQFGVSVAIENDLAVIGANNYGNYWEGAVYVFERQLTGEWIQQAKLHSNNYNEQFGLSVDISDSRIFVGGQTDTVYVYEKSNQQNWSKTKIIVPELYQNVSRKNVCAFGNYLAVGDPFNSDINLREGKVFIFQEDPVQGWEFLQVLIPVESSGTLDIFGSSLSFNENCLMIGAPMHMNLDNMYTSGTVYCFEFDADTLKYSHRIAKSLGQYSINYRFGIAVNTYSNYLIVSSTGEGACYLYEYNEGEWIEFDENIIPSDGNWTDIYGISVALSNNYALVGSPGHDGAYLDQGAAYLYSYITAVESEDEVPKLFSISQNYPNPFNASTKIEYSLPVKSSVVINVFDILGREVKVLFDGEKLPGNYEVNFSENNLTSGIYFLKISANEFTDVLKMVLLK